MNYFSIAILAGTLVSLALGVLLGLFRGMRRGVLRLALLVFCFILSLALCGTVSETLMGLELFDGKTLQAILEETLSSGGKSASDIILPMAQILAKLIAFVVTFALLQFVTWILVFPILKTILRPILGRRVRSRGLGALVGVACGAVVAFSLYVPLNGLFCEASKLASVDLSGISGDSGGSGDPLASIRETGIADYASSGISKFYNAVGGGFYRSLATVKDANGKEISLTTQIDALSAAAKIASKVAAIKNIQNEDGSINTAGVREIAGALSEMDDLTPEVKASLADMVKSLTEAMGDDVPEAIRNLDPEKIDFKNEGALLTTVADIIDADGNPASVNIKEAVENLSKSTVILPALAESSVTLPVDGETKAKAMEAINELESRTGNNAVDAGTVAKLKALFGEKTPAGE